MNFIAFIILTAVVIIRPSEIFDDILGAPLYTYAVLACLALSLPSLPAQLTPDAFLRRPIVICVTGMMFAIICPHLSRFNAELLIACLDEFFRLLLYFFLLLSAVTTKARLARALIFWVTIFFGILTLLCLLNLHHVIDLPKLEPMDEAFDDNETGARHSVIRLQATGIFDNPNSFARVLTAVVLLSLYWMTDPKMRSFAPLWAGMAGMFTYALVATKSRGGFLGLVFGLAVLFVSRFGFKRSIPLMCVALPGMFLLAGGRQTEISTGVGTAAHRIELWDAGLEALKLTRFLGIGMNTYQEYAHGYVAHNSFVHAYAELGYLGGTFFLGAYYLAMMTFWNLRKDQERITDPELRRLFPFLVAVIGGEIVGLLSISRNYVTSTYLWIGMSVVYIDLVGALPGIQVPRCDRKLVTRIFIVGAIGLSGLFAYVKYKLRNYD